MSVVTPIIELIKRKNTMETVENTPVIPTSQHPVLTALNEKIADLETKLVKANELDADRVKTIREVRDQKWKFEERVKNVLVEAYEDYDQNTITYIASQLDITLSKVKQYEVNVTFSIEVESEIGEEIDLDWDLDFSVSHSDIIDYSSDVIWTKEV
jgi:hypothetical protein